MPEILNSHNQIEEEFEEQKNYHAEGKAIEAARKIVRQNDKRISGRSFGFILWCDSASPDWLQLLEDSMLPFCISPCHDQDVATKDDTAMHDEYIEIGELVKPHYHIMVQWDNSTTLNNVKSVIMDLLNFDEFHPVNTVKKLLSPTGYFAYLTHSNRPEKHQYPESDLIFLNEFSVSELLKERDSDEMIKNIIQMADQNEWHHYSQAIKGTMASGMYQEFNFLRRNVAFFVNFFREEREFQKDLTTAKYQKIIKENRNSSSQ